MPELSIIVPARQEEFLSVTVDNILKNIEADTEIIAICDGNWPTPPLHDHKRVIVVHHTEPIGQRAATNEGARISTAEYIMKIDAHCAIDKGFDRKLIKDCHHRNWTLIPVMYNLNAFEWVCECGHKEGQGKQPEKCEKCESTTIKRNIIWDRRKGSRPTYSWRFDNNMQFQYWHKHKDRKENKGQLMETMSCIGACFFMRRNRFWDLGGMDESHGSWGQYGTELACKSWLSGGKMITTKNTWFAHMFRTGNFVGAFKNEGHGGSFPYDISNQQMNRARAYSRDIWLNDRWPKAKYPLSWLVDRFAPVPGWD